MSVCVLFLWLFVVSGRPLQPLPVAAQSSVPPGGFLDATTSTTARPLPGAAQIASFMPARGLFTFPAPYNTEGIRLTNAADCGGGDCVRPVGYSFWRNINNHAGSSTMLIFMGLDRQQGGGGPTLFSYQKFTGETRNLGPLFDAAHPLSWATGEGWYFSASRPNALYVFSGASLQRYDVLARTLEPVLDATTHFGGSRYIWNVHSSADDRVHSFTLRDSSTYAMLGCAAYREDTGTYQYFPSPGDLDECQIDKSGRYLLMKVNVDGAYGEDNVVVDLQTGAQQTLLDHQGAAGHSDNGFGYLVAEDNFHALPGAVRVWRLGEPLTGPGQGRLVFHTTSWAFGANHIAHSNARSDVPIEQQFACSSSANRQNLALANEVVCYRLDGSLLPLVVAPVMTDLNASGGGGDDYWKYPKGNLDVTGEYFVWTTNMGGGRLDAVMVRVPSHVLPNGPSTVGDVTPPAVSIASPQAGASVSGTVAIAASASDNVALAGVQFFVNGAPYGAEDTSAPYGVSWATDGLAPGTYSLSAQARDTSGNAATSSIVSVSLQGASAPPAPEPDPEPDPAPDPAPSLVVEPVAWTAIVNAQLRGAGLRKQGGCDGCADSGALSVQRIASGDGFVEFAVPDVKSMYFVGLGDANPGTTGGEIGFALRLQAGRAEVREGGVYKAEVPVGRSDLLRISVAGGHVTYARNSVVFYTSPLAVSYPLAVDVALYDSKAGVYNATIGRGGSGSTSPAPAPAPAPSTGATAVSWTQLVNASLSGDVLSKTGGCGGCPDAGAVSQQAVTADGGYFEFVAPEVAGLRFAGLGTGAATTTSAELVYAIRIQAGRAEVRELGVYRAETVASPGDVFRIAIQGGTVRYLRNGTAFYEAPASAAYPLRGDVAFYDLGTSVSQAVIAPGGGTPQP